jgi:hypothetical protein
MIRAHRGCSVDPERRVVIFGTRSAFALLFHVVSAGDKSGGRLEAAPGF